MPHRGRSPQLSEGQQRFQPGIDSLLRLLRRTLVEQINSLGQCCAYEQIRQILAAADEQPRLVRVEQITVTRRPDQQLELEVE